MAHASANGHRHVPMRENRSLTLALAAAKTAEDNRGREIVVLDLRELTPIFDYFVIVTGTSRRQLHAISEGIDHTLEDDLGDTRMSVEGYDNSRWIVLDYGDVVIHIFDDETRKFYDLEGLWGPAKRVELVDVLTGDRVEPVTPAVVHAAEEARAG